MSDLHDQLRAAIEQRLATARRVYDAEPGAWRVGPGPSGRPQRRFWILDPDGDWLAEVGTADDAEFIAANSPDVIIRHCSRDLAMLDRHEAEPECEGIGGCLDIDELAAAYVTDIPGSPQ